MSSLPFSIDMETMEGHVPSTSEFITPQISAKTKRGRFPPNGLTGTSQQDMDTREDKSMNVIVHSEQAKSSAETLRDEMQKQCHSVSLLCVREPTDLKEKISLDSVTGLYMMVDPSLFELLFQRKVHRGLHSDVYDFMDELEEKNKCISLFNKMEKGDDRFRMLFYHLPKKCVKIVKQITVQGGKVKDMNKRSSKSIDSGIADLSLNENSKQKSGGAAADSGNKLRDGPSSDQRVKTDSIKTGPGGDSREIDYSQKDAGLMSSPPEGLMASSGNAELYSEESPEGKAEVKSEDKEELELTDEESLSEDSEEEPQSNVDVQAVQIGHHQTMEVQWTGSQMVNASQEGWNNTLEVNIVPQASKSKVIVVFTTNPRDENLDNLLVKEFNDETELINVRVADLGGSNVKVSSGSVVMEIEVKPGVTIDKHYIEKLMNIIFSGKAGKVVPENTKFDVDIQTKMMVPFDQLGKYLHLNPEKIHENCVSKEKYEEKVKEIQQLQSRLVQGILKNPKQDQVLQSALKNFISSVLTDFAFAMATEIPALPVSGSLRRQEATDREEERNPMVSGRRTSLEQENEVQGFSQRVDSGYNEITPRKGSWLIEEQSDTEPSSTEITTRHSKWRFDVLIIRGEDTFGLRSLNELFKKQGFKCETIDIIELLKDHHMSSQSVVFSDPSYIEEDLFELISLQHRRFICLISEDFELHRLYSLQQDGVLTVIDRRRQFWREDLLEQLGRKEHQKLGESTFDKLAEKTHELFDLVYGYRPDFSVKRNGPKISIQWTEQKQRKVGMTPLILPGKSKEHMRALSWRLETIFILHCDADKEFAHELRKHLEDTKGLYKCSLLSELDELSPIMRSSSTIIIIVSKNLHEYNLPGILMGDDNIDGMHKEDKKIIPVVLDNASVPQGLQSFKKVVVGKKFWQEKLTALLKLSVESKISQMSTQEKIGKMFPELLQEVYDGVEGIHYTQSKVQHRGDTFTIEWTEVEESSRRKLFTIGSLEEGETTMFLEKDSCGSTRTETEEYKVADSAEKLAQEDTKPKKTEIYDTIAKKLKELGDEIHETNPLPQDTVRLPEAIGRELAYIGDRIDDPVKLEDVLESYLRREKEERQYEDFREAVHKSLGSESSWRVIASVLYATKNVMSRFGTSMAAPLRQLAEKFVQEECADFIIQQGGWEAVLDEEGSDFDID